MKYLSGGSPIDLQQTQHRPAAHELQVDRVVQYDARGAARHARRIDHDHRDARHLPRHPPEPPGIGQQLLPAVDGARISDRLERADREPRSARRHVRPRAHLQPRLRRLHGGVAAAHDRLADRHLGCHLPRRDAPLPGRRRSLPTGQLGSDHHRRVPEEPARHGAGDQQHRRRQRHVHRPRARWPACSHQLATGVPDLGARRPVRNRVGLHASA